MSKYGPKVRSVPERFWSHVVKSDGCWEWVAARNTFSYGVAVAEGRRITKAHRLSWELAFGPIPSGLYVLHRCDNPPCVRPDHLFVGTQRDNARDASRKGRMNFGTTNGSHTKPEAYSRHVPHERAVEIRGRYTGKRGEIIALAREYGVGRGAVRRIVRREVHNW